MAAPKPNSRLGRLESFTEDRIYNNDFDARDYAKDAASAAFSDYQDDLDQGIEQIRGESVSMGRLRTGFGAQDEERFAGRLEDRLARELARGAFNAASLDLDNESLLDTRAAGMHDILQARRNQNQKKRRGLLGFLGSGLGAVGGFVLGGPAGAAAGAKAGGTLGRSI